MHFCERRTGSVPPRFQLLPPPRLCGRSEPGPDFGETFIEEKRAERRKRNEPEKPVTPEPLPKPDVFDQVLGALCGMGFPKRKAATVMAQLQLEQAEPEAVLLIRAAVDRLTPPARFYG